MINPPPLKSQLPLDERNFNSWLWSLTVVSSLVWKWGRGQGSLSCGWDGRAEGGTLTSCEPSHSDGGRKPLQTQWASHWRSSFQHCRNWCGHIQPAGLRRRGMWEAPRGQTLLVAYLTTVDPSPLTTEVCFEHVNDALREFWPSLGSRQ